jgi:hypothetical protein
MRESEEPSPSPTPTTVGHGKCNDHGGSVVIDPTSSTGRRCDGGDNTVNGKEVANATAGGSTHRPVGHRPLDEVSANKPRPKKK